MKKLIIALLLLAPVVSGAQMKPTVPSEMKGLTFLIGTWAGDVDLFMGSQKMTGPVTVKHEWVLDGLYMQATLEHKLPMGVVKGVTFTAYDAKAKQFKTWTFTNEGGTPGPRVEVGLREGPSITLTTAPGEALAYRQKMTRRADGSLHFLLEFKSGDKYVKAAEGVLRKKG